MMRIVIVLTALVFASATMAQSANQYSCTVTDMNYFGDDAEFLESNLRKKYLIHVGEDQIYLTQTSAENTYQMIYSIDSRSMSDVYASNMTTVARHTIAINEFYFENKYSATLTYQSPLTANVWKLDCQSQ